MFRNISSNIVIIGLISFCGYVSTSKNLYLPPSNRFDAGYMPPINQNFLPELLQRPNVYGPANFNPPQSHYIPPNYFPPPMYQIPHPSFHHYYPIDVPITTPSSQISITTSSPNNNPSTVSPPVRGNIGGYPSYPSYFPGACWCGGYPQPSYAPPTTTVVPVSTSTPQTIVSSPAPISSSSTLVPPIQPPVTSSPVDGSGQTPAPIPPPANP